MRVLPMAAGRQRPHTLADILTGPEMAQTKRQLIQHFPPNCKHRCAIKLANFCRLGELMALARNHW